ncbi:hypothetical protein ABEQ41_26305 [Priestia megaterium]
MDIMETGIEVHEDMDRHRDLDTVRRMLRSEAQKKLESIRFHLTYHHQLGVIIESKEDLFAFLSSDEATEEIVWGILELLDQSFSRGYPNYIYEFELRSNITEVNFYETIKSSIPKDQVIRPTGNRNTSLTRRGDIYFSPNNCLKFKIEYERYKNPPRNGTNALGPLEIKTTFDIIFDFQASLCYIQCGDKKILNAIEDILKNKILGVFSKCNSYLLKQKQNSTEFQGEYSLDKQTVIVLDYVEETINSDNHEIADYSGMSFSNARSEKVKSVRLKGRNLLESYEVADRIRTGDQIKSVRFQLRKRLLNDKYLIPTINVDFNGPLKITLNNVENTNYNTDIIRHLVKALNFSIKKTYKEQETKDRLADIIQIARVRESLVLQSVLAEIRTKLEEITVNPTDKDQFIQLLDRYRV